jgi:hypothetical protein
MSKLVLDHHQIYYTFLFVKGDACMQKRWVLKNYQNNIPAITGIPCDNKQPWAPFTFINTYENVS